jgi:hypothetical protein
LEICAARSAIPSSTRRLSEEKFKHHLPRMLKMLEPRPPHAAAQVTEESVYAAPFLFADAVGSNVLPCFSGRLRLSRGARGLTDAATTQSAVRLASRGGR